MRFGYACCLTSVIIAIICSCAYLYANRYAISTTEKIAYVYDTFTNNVQIFTMRDRKEKTDMDSPDVQRLELSKKVKMSVSYAPESCSGEYPVHVTITNGTDRKILDTTFNLDVRVRGRSSTLVVKENNSGLPFYPRYHHDEVIEPGYTASACFAIPKLSKAYDDAKMEIVPFQIDYTFLGILSGNMDAVRRFDGLPADE